MKRDFRNVYAEDERARSYAGLEFPGTYYLAFRDLPELIGRHVRGCKALDFGCGAGRSSRFLKDLGFEVVGVDIAERMLTHARARDPEGDYRFIPDGNLSGLQARTYDLVLAAFTFDNIPGHEKRLRIFRDFERLLTEDGRICILASAPEIYLHEWASFSTKDFSENPTAGSGDSVRIVMLDVEDRRPVEDVLWLDADYRKLALDSGLEILETHKPLGRASDPCSWVSETRISPWSIYKLRRRS